VTLLREVCTGKAFSLVRFFDAYQRNELARAAGETPLILASSTVSEIETNGESKRRKSEAFAFGDFISFDKRQKKRSKEKRFLVQSSPGDSSTRGFF